MLNQAVIAVNAVKSVGYEEPKGKDEQTAINPIEAAIGAARTIAETQDKAEPFNNEAIRKYEQISAAIVLRALAKDGAFAV